MQNKCEYSGKVLDVSTLTLISGSGSMEEVNEKNGLTISKWRCPCGKSVDVKPVAGSTGTVRWHDVKVQGAAGGMTSKAGTNAGTLAGLAVFISAVAAQFATGDVSKAMADAVDYVSRLTASIADRQEAIARLTADVETRKADASKARDAVLRLAALIPDDATRLAFGVSMADAMTPKPKPEPATVPAPAE
jgi:hypothetical protein